MVILDEKTVTMYPPPPPYALPDPVSPPPFPSHNRPPPTLVTLPPHLLLRIVYETFPPGTLKNQRKVLYWLTMSLRLVNRALYVGEFNHTVALGQVSLAEDYTLPFAPISCIDALLYVSRSRRGEIRDMCSLPSASESSV